jgi:hypothetical protein
VRDSITVKQALLLAVGSALSDRLFEKKGKTGIFSRQRSYGSDRCLVMTRRMHGGLLGANVLLHIRHDAIERLAAPLLSQKASKMTATIGVELGQLESAHYRTWVVGSLAVVPSVAGEIYSVFEEKALPFYDRFGNLQQLFEELAVRAGKEPFSVAVAACARAIVAARLLGRGQETIRKILERTAEHIRFGTATDPQRLLAGSAFAILQRNVAN